MSMPLSARTDVGLRRDHNEDAHLATPPLLAVADGVGGSARGEVASQRALDALATHVDQIAHAASADEAARAMEAAVLAANRAVHEAQAADEQLRGMATTLVATVVRDGGELIVGHVGDSRIYVVSAAGARAVTDDHSVVAELVRAGRIDATEAAHHPQRNVITRALGPEPDVAVDAFVLHVGPGDWVLLCSDGLTEHVTDAELAQAVVAHQRDPDAITTALVELANERGGSDNITVVVAQPVPSDVSGELRIEALQAAMAEHETTAQQPGVVSDAPADASGPLPVVERDVEASGEIPVLRPLDVDEDRVRERDLRPARAIRAWMVIVLVALAGAGIGALVWSQSYFLTERGDGRVGIDRGFPVAGLSSNWRTSEISVAELSATDRERLVYSHRLLSRDDAMRVLDDLTDRVEAPDGEAPHS